MTTPRRLALLLPNLGGGGAERVALALMRGLLARGFEVDLLLVRRAGELLPLIPAAVTVIELGGGSLRGAFWPLIRYLRRRRPHALHAMMWPLTAIAVVARIAARVKTRLVLSDHTILSRQYDGARALRPTIGALYPRAEARVQVSTEAADDLARIGGLARAMIEVVHNPLDLPAGVARDRAAAPWQDGDAARIVTVGVLKEEKNHALLLRAFARVVEHRRVLLAIVGDGPLRPRLEALAAELGIADYVVFAGYLLDPWPWLRSADLFVLSSDYEGFGNVLVEALHAGLPVVSTDCPAGPHEILAGGRFGTLVSPGDAEAMARAIETAIETPADPSPGRQRALELSGDASIERHLALMLG